MTKAKHKVVETIPAPIAEDVLADATEAASQCAEENRSSTQAVRAIAERVSSKFRDARKVSGTHRKAAAKPDKSADTTARLRAV